MNDNKTVNTSSILFIIGAAMIVIGVVMSIISGISAVQAKSEASRYRSAEGVIRDVEILSVNPRMEYGDVYAEYEVDGKTYKSRIYDYPDPPITGASVTVYYDPSSPENTIKSDPSAKSQGGSIFVNLSLVGLGVVIVLIARASRNARTNEEIRARYKSYEEYGGEVTERAGTLFDQKVSPEDTKFSDDFLPARMRTRSARKFRKFFGLGEYGHYK